MSVDFSRVRRIGYYPNSTPKGGTPTYSIAEYRVRMDPEQGPVWTFIDILRVPPQTRRQLRRSRWKDVPQIFEGQPLDEADLDRILQGIDPDKVDWRPDATIPEDYYAR